MFKRLLQYTKTCKKTVFLTPICVVIEVVTEVLIPVCMGFILDVGVKNNDFPYILRIGFLMVGLAVIALIFGILATRFAAISSTEFAKNIRADMYTKLQDYSFSNIDKFSTSSIITRLTVDVSNLQNSFQMVIRVAFRAPLLIIFSIIMSAIVGGSLSLVYVVMIPFLAVCLYFIMTRAHKHFMKMFVKIDRINQVIQEDLIGIRTVKSYVRENHEIEKFNESSDEVSKTAKKAEKIIIFNGPVMQFATYATIILLSFIGSRLMVRESLTEGQFSNVLTYIMQILNSLMMVSNVFMMIIMSRSSAKRIAEILDEKSTIVSKENAITNIKDGSINYKDVFFSYEGNEDKTILSSINLDIKSGDFIGIIGSTGSGKTTLIQLLSRLYEVTDGSVLVGGIDVRDYELESLRKNVITVLQKNVLFSGTIRDNIKWGKLDATDDEIIEALKKAQAYEFILKMPKGIDTWIEQGGVNVSGGQRQRLCIARALISEPRILILDDSTSAVDTKTDSLIRKTFREKLPDMTKIIVAQRVSSIEEADKIIVLDKGIVTGIGTHDELLNSNKIYKEVYDSQKGGENHDA